MNGVLAFSLPSSVALQGLVLGLNYGLLALGLVLIYRSSRVVNFAHGQLGVVSAVLLAKLVVEYHFPYWPSLGFCLLVALVVGALSELVLRRLFSRPRLIVMVATIGLAQALFLCTLLPFVAPKHFNVAYPLPLHAGFTLGGYRFNGGHIVTLIAAPLIAFGVASFFGLSRQGLAMRAAAENADSARLSGVWVKRTSTVAWMLAGLLSALSAILASPLKANAFAEALGPEALLRALAAALIGSMTNLPVAFGAGVAIGLFERVSIWNVHLASTNEVLLFVVLIAALVLRIRGQRVGARDEERSSWQFGADALPVTTDPLRAQVGRVGIAATGVVLLLLPLVLDNARSFLVSRMFVFAVVALSMTVLTGWAGQLSLGQFALVAVGAVVTAHLADSVPLILLLPLAGVVGAAVAVVVGVPALRVKGLYLAVSTLAFALLMQVAVLSTPCWDAPILGHVCTGLPDPSTTLIKRPSFLGFSLTSQKHFYYFALLVLVVTLAVMRTWRDRGLARDMVAVRDNEVAAAAMGIRVVRTKLLAFALSGFMAGVAGVCYALVFERFSVQTFAVSESIRVVSMIIIGGLGSITGALLGALYLIGIPALFGSGPTVQFLTSGIGLLVFILYLPGGLASVLQRLGDAVTNAFRDPELDELPAAPTPPLVDATPP